MSVTEPLARALATRTFLAGGALTLACLVPACQCADAPPRGGAGTAEPAPEVVVLTPPPAVPQLPAAPDGVAIPPTLTRQLDTPHGGQRSRDAQADPIDGCAAGCALIDSEQRLVIVRPRDEDGDGIPARIEVLRVEGREVTRRELTLTESDGDAGTELPRAELEERWSREVRRALGEGPYRPAPSLVVARARTFFAREEHSPLVALGTPLAERWLYAEVGETAYRVHLLRADRSVDRLLATAPLVVAPCDVGVPERACVAPLAIDEVLSTPDGRSLVALVDHPGAGAAQDLVDTLVLPLEDASALSTAYDAAVREAELERSLRAPGARVTWFADEAPVDASRGARCRTGCVLYREDGGVWLVRPTRIEHGQPRSLQVFAPDGTVLDGLGMDELEVASQARVLEASLTGAPDRPGRALVARQGVAASEGLATVPLVELRAPHVGVRVAIEVDGDEYVVRWTEAGATHEVGRVPAIRGEHGVAAPSLIEVLAPPDAGYPVVVLGGAAVRGPADEGGAAHASFHVVIDRVAR